MSTVPQIRLVQSERPPLHDHSPVPEIDWDEIEREQRGAAIIILFALVGAILIVSFCIGSLIWSADLPPMHLGGRP